MDASPSPTAANGRDGATGRFVAGNKCARGNPFARRVAELRQAVLDAVGPEDVKAVVAALLVLAKAGDVPAAKLVLDRALGPCEAADVLARVEAVEAALGLAEEVAS